MLGNASFYNETTRRYIAMVGTIFNDIKIVRKDNADVTTQTFTVPISYAPIQKLLARIAQDPDLDQPSAISLPRMSFEMVSMIYDGDRKLTKHQLRKKTITADDSSFTTQFVPAPYNLEFQLNIIAKYPEDAMKIVEQIIPYFTPNWTSAVKLLDDFDDTFDIPLILNGISYEDTYEGNFEDRRAVIWTLSFTLKGYYFGPTQNKKVIKFADVDVYGKMDANTALESVQVQPGLTANGEPTTDINETIPYADINYDDDWAFIVQIEDAD